MHITLNHSKTGPQDHEILEAVGQILNSDKKIFVLEGGSGAGKSWVIMCVQIILAMAEEGQRFVWMRERLTWFRTSIFKEFKKLMTLWDLWDENHHNKSMFEYILNGNEIYYTGLDEKSKFLSTDWDYGWINEAIDDRITYDDFYQIVVRTKKKLFLDYNPSKIDSWIYDQVIPRDDCEFIHLTIFDNPYAPVARKEELLRTTDPILRLIYLEGKRAQAKGLIYPHVFIVPDYPTDPKRQIVGLDFGFVNAPTAVFKMCYNHGELWIDELGYEYGIETIDNPQGLRSIESIFREGGLGFHDEIIADSNEMGAIRALRSKGWNIMPANKYAGSVVDGIDQIKRYKINITERSENLIKEQRQYKWAEVNGVVINKPVKAYDHGWDAVRYGNSYRASAMIMPGGGGVSRVKLGRN